MDSAVGIDLAAGLFLPLSQLVPLKLVSQRFKGKFRDHSLALDVRPPSVPAYFHQPGDAVQIN